MVNFCVLSLATLLCYAHAVSASVETRPSTGTSDISTTWDHTQVILDWLEEAKGADRRAALQDGLSGIVEALNHTFVSLPKRSEGTVDAPVARYAVHRFFVQRHGWQIAGLAPGGKSWSSSSPVKAFGDQIPAEIAKALEDRLETHGFDLSELAFFASLLENLVISDQLGQLRTLYAALGKSVTSPLSRHDALDLIETFMAARISGADVAKISHEERTRMMTDVTTVYTYWNQTRTFLHDIVKEGDACLAGFAFSDVVRFVEIATRRFGQNVDSECQDLQDRLALLEEVGSAGRVGLLHFYTNSFEDDKWYFSERPEYLRTAGILDESEASMPHVMIPNYLHSVENCLGFSKQDGIHHGLCCRDRCENLMGYLEKNLQAPSATPEAIMSLATNLMTTSAPAAHTLPDTLVHKLQEVAHHHGGRVPLYGRLFAQWMHMAFPRECQFPHVANAKTPMNNREFEEVMNLSVSFTNAELVSYAKSLHASWSSASAIARPAREKKSLHLAMWDPTEELISADVEKSKRRAVPVSVRAAFRVLAVLAIIAATLKSVPEVAWQMVFCSETQRNTPAPSADISAAGAKPKAD